MIYDYNFVFSHFVFPFLWTGSIFDIFQLSGKIREFLNTINIVFTIAKSQVSIIRVNLLSWSQVLAVITDMESNSITMETLEDEITNRTLDNDIIVATNSIRESRKRPDECSIIAYLQKQTNNQNIFNI